MMLPFALVTTTAVVALLAADYRNWRPGVWIAKPIAAGGFIAAAFAVGALQSVYGQWVLAALILSWFGDVLLIPRASAAFLLGLGSFLLAHLAFAVAFFVRGYDAPVFAGAICIALVVGAMVCRWLWPHLKPAMRVPVVAYALAISVMVALSISTTAATGQQAIALGAAGFFLSDLAVARNRFVAPGFINRLWGSPLYFAAQLVLAGTVAG